MIARASPTPVHEIEDPEAILDILHVELPAHQCEVVELAYFYGLSQSEIADLLNVPIGTVKGRIRMALVRLRSMFSAVDLAEA